MAQGQCHDELRWRQAEVDGAQPGSELQPNHVQTEPREGLEGTLGDEPELQVGVIGNQAPLFELGSCCRAYSWSSRTQVVSPANPRFSFIQTGPQLRSTPYLDNSSKISRT